MYNKKVKTQVYLLSDSFARLRREADRRDMPYAQLIREAVDYYLDEKVTKKPKKIDWQTVADEHSVNMGGDVASKIDEILYQ